MYGLKKKLQRNYHCLRLGIESPADMLMKAGIFIMSAGSRKDRSRIYKGYLERKIIKKYLKNGIFAFKDVKLPDISKNEKYMRPLPWVFYDILFFYTEKQDVYNEYDVKTFEKYFAAEGTYIYENQDICVRVEPGDIVIDAGAWIGPFSAYASKKGATVYAFEPSSDNLAYLEQTAKLNGNINIVPLGLYDIKGRINFIEDAIGSRTDQDQASDKFRIETTTVDDFVKENNIQKVDSIKADIEGAERNMLAGARQTLKDHAPKLSLCTYHHEDDPEILAKMILEASPNYKIVQGKMKLYAQA